jgi:transposase
MSTMRRYTPEFRESAVRLVRSGEVTRRRAAEDLGVPYFTLQGWIRKARGSGRRPPPPDPKEPPRTLADAEARVRALEAEVRKLTLEKEILK